ncbi:DNA-directed RNA polymerase subunit epsilon [Ligilactobacillus saerimneri]|uniref:DNA-directed RNA polymerase subunit epsilon n=1 Tax=Ligilactobacillus saerimneri TaxID=228229 RepID=UPI0030D160A6
MIFKVYYQPSMKINPRRENTRSLYLDADSEVSARRLVEENTTYNIEYIEQLDEKALAYEQESPDFKVTEFNAE